MKKENRGLMILVVILLIVAVVVGAFVGYKRAAQNDKKNDIDSKSVAKLDESKDYVYDADYTGVYKNQYTEYTSGNTTIKLSDLKVPYINIDSYYAGHTNGELEALYKDRAERFDSCARGNIGCASATRYEAYKYNDILSVVVIYSFVFENGYKTYNFDLKTGNEISYDEMITRLGYDKNTLLDKEKEVIKKKMDETNNTSHYDLTKTCGGVVDVEENCYDIAYKMLEDSINDNSILYFADENGKFNIIAIPYTRLWQNSTSAKYVFTIEK